MNTNIFTVGEGVVYWKGSGMAPVLNTTLGVQGRRVVPCTCGKYVRNRGAPELDEDYVFLEKQWPT